MAEPTKQDLYVEIADLKEILSLKETELEMVKFAAEKYEMLLEERDWLRALVDRITTVPETTMIFPEDDET